jgi:hypothetical protein
MNEIINRLRALSQREAISDIIKRLRALSQHKHDDLSVGDEGADIIEQLRAERDEWETACGVARDERDGLRAELRLAADRAALADKKCIETEADVEALKVLLRRHIELCAIGDTDETTESYGWGELIAESKAAIDAARREA